MEEKSDFSDLQNLALVEYALPLEANVQLQETKRPQNGKIGQEQIHTLLFGDTLSWQAIIYDLINTEQLDPWDIDLSFLASKFLEKVRQLEEANFFVSSKVLFASSFLLRMKSELLLDRDITELDNILYGRKEEKKYIQERLELDEDIPELMLRTPLPRYKKVTLEELMKALDVAIKTENRRIEKVVLTKQQEFETMLSIPKTRINIQDSIKKIYSQLEEIFKNQDSPVAFSKIVGKDKSREKKIQAFVPLLHLDNQQKVWLEQANHQEEIWILLKHIYENKNRAMLAQLKAEVEGEIGKLDFHDIDDTIQEQLTPEEDKKLHAEMFANPEEEED